MTATTPTPDVREQLITGGLRLISEAGSADLSVRHLAQAADRTTMCVYTKFGNRRGLVSALYERAAAELLALLDAPGTSLPALAQTYCEFADAHPTNYEFLFMQPMAALDIDASLRANLVNGIVSRFTAAAIGPHAADAARAVWSTVHGLTTLHSLDATSRPRRIEEIVQTIDAITRGLDDVAAAR